MIRNSFFLIYLSIEYAKNFSRMLPQLVLMLILPLEYNRQFQKMSLKLILLLLALTSLSFSFARNCQVFSPASFNLCSLCVRGFYAVNGICIQCPTARSTIRECSTTTSVASVQNTTNTTNGTTSNSNNQTTTNVSSVATALSNSTVNTNGSSTQSNNSTVSTNGSTNTATSSTNNNTNSTSSTPTPNNTNNTNNTDNFPNTSTTSNTSSIPSTSTQPNTTNTSNTSNVSPQSSTQPNTTNTSNTPNVSPQSTVNTPSATSTQQNTPPPISDLAQIIFKHLPPNCRQFVVSPVPACRSCEKGFILTSNNACQPEPPRISATTNITQSIPASLKVSSSLPTQTPALPIVTNQPIPQSTPQPILLPISTDPTNNTRNPSPTTVTNTTSTPAAPVRDPNCLTPNPSFDPRLPASPQNARCQVCFRSFFFNLTAQRCMPVDPLCLTATSQNDCKSCYPGYQLSQGRCIIAAGQITISTFNPAPSFAPTVAPDPNCQRYLPNSPRCEICANRYYFDTSRNICATVDSSCQTWNSNGFCTSCYTGFSAGPNDRSCRPSPKEDASKCLRKINGRCTSCAFRSFLREGVCFQVSDLCSTFNPTNGDCLSCYNGYQLYGNTCGRIIPHCLASSVNGCNTCIDGYFPNNKGDCQPVSLLCNGYNPQNGFCLDCIFPYTLDPASGQCLYLP